MPVGCGLGPVWRGRKYDTTAPVESRTPGVATGLQRPVAWEALADWFLCVARKCNCVASSVFVLIMEAWTVSSSLPVFICYNIHMRCILGRTCHLLWSECFCHYVWTCRNCTVLVVPTIYWHLRQNYSMETLNKFVECLFGNEGLKEFLLFPSPV